MDKTFDLAYELRKCTECSCSRCNLCGTPNCYVEIAIKELDRYDQVMDSLVDPGVPCAPGEYEPVVTPEGND